jgi:hypothetical protein
LNVWIVEYLLLIFFLIEIKEKEKKKEREKKANKKLHNIKSEVHDI